MSTHFELQGHRGARGLRPENTLPSFEAALDAGVDSVETDLHLTRDGVPVVSHDPLLGGRLCGALPFPEGTPISQLTLAQLRLYRLDRNPDPRRFPGQAADVPPLAARFAEERGLEPYGVPTLAELFDFAAAYAGDLGERSGKSAGLRDRARRVVFDLEMKRVPFHPEAIGDDFTGGAAGLLERLVAEAVRAAGVVGRTRVRSFDHRSVRALREIAPEIEGAVLVADTAVVDPAKVARQAGAAVYCPSYTFLDEEQVRKAHVGGVRVLPWTVNDARAWRRLLAWGVDGLTTDFPDRLAAYLQTPGAAG
jgi:glycerophosphoryl diester phosphodiesterase